MYRKSRLFTDSASAAEKLPRRQEDTLKLTDQYIGLLILVFTSAGLIDVRDPEYMSRVATYVYGLQGSHVYAGRDDQRRRGTDHQSIEKSDFVDGRGLADGQSSTAAVYGG